MVDNLAVSAQGFRRGANRVRKQMWWKVTSLSPPPLCLRLNCGVWVQADDRI
jgi:hypothetical protein